MVASNPKVLTGVINGFKDSMVLDGRCDDMFFCSGDEGSSHDGSIVASLTSSSERYVWALSPVTGLVPDELLQEFTSLTTMTMNTRRISVSFLHNLGHS